MRVVVREAFHDKFHFARIFNSGEVVDFVEERAQDLIKRGLAEKVHADGVQEGDKPPKVEDAGDKTMVSGSSEGANAETVSVNADAGNYAAGAKKKSEEAAAAKIAKVKAKMNK